MQSSSDKVEEMFDWLDGVTRSGQHSKARLVDVDYKRKANSIKKKKRKIVQASRRRNRR